MKINEKQVKDFFYDIDNISKYSENAYLQLDIDILRMFRFIEWIEEEIYNEQTKYEYSEDCKQNDMVEIIRYQQNQALEMLRMRLIPELKNYFEECYILEGQENGKED